jgi:hypothetical protein
MKADYMTLPDGRKVRFELNLNSMSEWSEKTGLDLQDIDRVKAKPLLLRSLAYYCIAEGERLDNRELELSEAEFGGMCRMEEIVEIAHMIQAQGSMMGKKKQSQTAAPARGKGQR